MSLTEVNKGKVKKKSCSFRQAQEHENNESQKRVKLLISVFGHGWKWIIQLEKTISERFQVLCLYLAKIIEQLIMFCTPCEHSLDIALLVLQEHFVCERSR